MAKSFERIGKMALFLVPLAPLAVYLGFLFPYMSGRNFFFRACVLTALAAWIILWIREPERYRKRRSFLMWAILVFVAFVGIATLLASNRSFAFWSSLERMDGFISILFLAAFFFSARALLRASEWRIFFNISISVAMVVSVTALFQLAGLLEIHQGGVRIDATFGNASFFAVYMLLSTGLALFLAAANATTRRARLLYSACSVLFLPLILASATRSAFLALPVALTVSCITALFFRRESVALRRFGFASLIILVCLGGAFFALRSIPSAVSHPLLGRLLSVSFSGQDAEARLISWRMALEGAAERPFFGWGPEGFRYVFAKHYDPHLYGREQWFDRAHNTYLDWLVQAGALGLLAYLALWFGLARAVWRNSAFSVWEKVALAGMFSGYAAFNMFSFDTITASVLFFAFLAYADTCASQNSILQSPRVAASLRDCRSTRHLQNAFCYTLVIVCVFVFYYVIAKPAYAAYLVSKGLRDNSTRLEAHLDFFERAIAQNTLATPEAREFLAQFAVNIWDSPLSAESRGRVITLAAQELAAEIEQSPEDPRYIMRLGTLLNTYRQYATALPVLERALALSPRKQPTIYELGTSLLNLGRFNDAVQVFKYAAELMPESEDIESKKLYTVALVYAKQVEESEAYARRIFGNEGLIDSRLADAYRRTGETVKAKRIMATIQEQEDKKLYTLPN